VMIKIAYQQKDKGGGAAWWEENALIYAHLLTIRRMSHHLRLPCDVLSSTCFECQILGARRHRMTVTNPSGTVDDDDDNTTDTDAA
jgi:hypothetical protein